MTDDGLGSLKHLSSKTSRSSYIFNIYIYIYIYIYIRTRGVLYICVVYMRNSLFTSINL